MDLGTPGVGCPDPPTCGLLDADVDELGLVVKAGVAPTADLGDGEHAAAHTAAVTPTARRPRMAAPLTLRESN